jgi:hypothetical protein
MTNRLSDAVRRLELAAKSHVRGLSAHLDNEAALTVLEALRLYKAECEAWRTLQNARVVLAPSLPVDEAMAAYDAQIAVDAFENGEGK